MGSRLQFLLRFRIGAITGVSSNAVVVGGGVVHIVLDVGMFIIRGFDFLELQHSDVGALPDVLMRPVVVSIRIHLAR